MRDEEPEAHEGGNEGGCEKGEGSLSVRLVI
jgi:hypothetical protein